MKILRLLAFALMTMVAMCALADTTHTVKKGESIGGIAYMYNISIEKLIEHNPQAKQGVRTGMVLTIPEPGNDSYSKPGQADSRQPAAQTQQPAAQASQPEPEPEPIAQETAPDPDKPLVHKTVTGDTFGSIATKYQIPIGDLIDLNPFVDPKSMPVGTIIRLSDNAPYFDDAEEDTADDSDDEDEDEEEAEPLPLPDFFTEPAVTEPVPAYGEETVEEMPRFTILVLLPFMSESEEPSKQAQQYAEFYRGLLLAANDAKYNGMPEVEIIAYDTSVHDINVTQIITGADSQDIAVAIAPGDEALLNPISNLCAENGIYTINCFNVKDEAWTTNSHMLQTYISQSLMYDKALDAMLELYPGYIPVILDPQGARAEKEPFIEALRARYDQEGITPIDLPFDEALAPSDILGALKAHTPHDIEASFVFIPKTGSQTAFNRFAGAIAALMENADDSELTDDADPGPAIADIVVFGYPDWTAFRGESLELLQKLQATVYSRFFYDSSSPEARKMQQNYQTWYGRAIQDAIPSQAVLGYDTGACLLQWIQKSNGHFGSMLNPSNAYTGLQSTFAFQKANVEGGYINGALYIVTFMPDNKYEITVR